MATHYNDAFFSKSLRTILTPETFTVSTEKKFSVNLASERTLIEVVAPYKTVGGRDVVKMKPEA